MLIVDSGSNYCAIDRKYGSKLGLDIEAGVADGLTTEHGERPAWYHTIIMEVEDRRFECQCGFSDLSDYPVIDGILGRDGFFNRFTVTFEERKKIVVLKYRDEDLIGPHR